MIFKSSGRFIFFLLLFFSCLNRNESQSNNATESTSDSAVTLNFSKILDPKFYNKQVMIDGYISPLDSIYHSYATNMRSDTSLQSYYFILYQRKNQFYSDTTMLLQIRIGDGRTPNTIAPLPINSGPEDVKITGHLDEAIKLGDHVGLNGLIFNKGDQVILLVLLIDKFPDPDTIIDYSTIGALRVSPSNISSGLLKGKLVYAEGLIEKPLSILDGLYTNFKLNVEEIKDPIVIDIAYGFGPSKVRSLSQNYSGNIEIYDDKNKPIHLNRKIRVYGVWDGNGIRVENINNISN
jgi:hypothetical protein